MAVMRAIIVGAVLAGCLAGPVYAQQKDEKNQMLQQMEQKKRDAEAIDKQYRSTLERTRKDTTTEVHGVDPWQNMRGPDETKTKR